MRSGVGGPPLPTAPYLNPALRGNEADRAPGTICEMLGVFRTSIPHNAP